MKNKSKILDMPEFNGLTIKNIDVYPLSVYLSFGEHGVAVIHGFKSDNTFASVDSVVGMHTISDGEIRESFIEIHEKDIMTMLRIRTAGGFGYISWAGYDIKLNINYSPKLKDKINEDTTLGELHSH